MNTCDKDSVKHSKQTRWTCVWTFSGSICETSYRMDGPSLWNIDQFFSKRPLIRFGIYPLSDAFRFPNRLHPFWASKCKNRKEGNWKILNSREIDKAQHLMQLVFNRDYIIKLKVWRAWRQRQRNVIAAAPMFLMFWYCSGVHSV